MRRDWKVIPNTNDKYVINSEGVVQFRHDGRRRTLTQHLRVNGYRQVCILFENGRRNAFVHRLVWETFKGPIPEGMYVLHGFGNDTVCCDLEYLRLGTTQDNNADMRRDGTHPSAKLTIKQVKFIKQQLAKGVQGKTLANKFRVAKSVISDIKLGRSYKYVTE